MHMFFTPIRRTTVELLAWRWLIQFACILLLLVTLPASTSAQCNCVPHNDPAHGFALSDSMRYDTCGLGVYPGSCTDAARLHGRDSAGFWRITAESGWFIQFSVDAIRLAPAPADTTLDVHWEAIDSTYLKLRSGFQAMENRFGPFVLRKRFPQADTGEASRAFILRLTTYQNIDTVVLAIDNVDSLVVCEGGPLFAWADNVAMEDTRETPHAAMVSCYPSPVGDLLHLRTALAGCDDRLVIADAIGRTVQVKECVGAHGLFEINVQNLPPGVYTGRWVRAQKTVRFIKR